jgi:hypothetical protein
MVPTLVGPAAAELHLGFECELAAAAGPAIDTMALATNAAATTAAEPPRNQAERKVERCPPSW